MKLLLKFLLLVAMFFVTLFVMRQVDWMTVLHVDEAKKSTETKLGELFWDMFRRSEDEVHGPKVEGAIDTLVTHLCRENKIDREKFKLHIIDKDMVNAFTLPDDHLVVLTGLVDEVESEAELLGVLGHEIAHAEQGHVMKKLMKEIGLSVLISMTNGGSGEVARQALQMLTSSAFDRELEREADLMAVDYLIAAKIDPEPFAHFLFRMSDDEKNIPRQAFWLSTHPESRERAEAIIEYIKGKEIVKGNVLSEERWRELKEAVSSKK